MKPSEYIEGALRTEHDEAGYEAVKPRVTHEDLALLAATLHKIAEYSEYLDHMKKKIFYGSTKPKTAEKVAQAKTILESQYDMKEFIKSVKPDVYSNTKNLRVLHALLGIVGESGEIAEALSNQLYGDELDVINIKEELGDIEWYKAIGLTALGLSFEEVWKTNYEKLHARYGEKFTESAAVDRDLEKEREVLESK